MPETNPHAEAFERLHRVGRQHQLGHSHASAICIGVALLQPLRIRERTDAMSANSHTGKVSAAERRQATGRVARCDAKAARPKPPALPHLVRERSAAIDALVLQLQQDSLHFGRVIEDRVAH